MRYAAFVLSVSWFLMLSPIPAPAAEPFELKDGDRVVFVGSTLIEREQRYGYWETMLTSHFPDRNVTFRNLGWSGDTVFGEARAGFDTPAEGYRRLKEHVLALKPTVIFIGYGTNESFEGEAGLPRFVEGMNKLFDDLAPAKARIVLLSPLRQEDLGRPLPDPSEHNKDVTLYRDALQKIAESHQSRFVNLYRLVDDATGRKLSAPLTDNGIHLTAVGYRRAAKALEEGLGLKPIRSGISPEQMEKLRETIVAKNRLYFHRWRPQNETYLFGFRKHEQGQNAKEIPEFDPLIEKLEAEIANLRKERE